MSMEYKLKSEDSRQLVFKESNALGCFMWLFPAIGFPIFLLGFLAMIGSFVENTPITGMDFILTGFGWTFTSTLGVMWVSKNLNPYQIVFDNANGLVRLYQKRKGGEVTSEIPYNEIDGFYIRHKTTSSSSSSSSSTRHIVYWIKKDGSIWDLCSYGRQSKAEDMKQKMMSLVKLNQTPKLTQVPKLPASVKLKKSADRIALEWRNKITIKYAAFLGLILGFCIIDVGIYFQWQENGDGTAFFVLTPFLSLVLGLLIFFSIRNLSTTYRLVITNQELLFEHVRAEKVTKKKSILLSDISAISFDFKDVMGGSPLKILNHQEYAQVQEAFRGEFNFSDIGKLISMAVKSFQINIDALDVVDKVELEKILQKVILEKGGVDVL